jgi:hypothetical protein
MTVTPYSVPFKLEYLSIHILYFICAKTKVDAVIVVVLHYVDSKKSVPQFRN